LLGLLLMQIAFFPASQSWAQTVIPEAGKAGVIQKSLERSRQVFQPPKEIKPPEIVIEDSRGLIDPGAGPSFLVKKVIVTGNTLVDDETIAPLVDVGEDGLEMTLGILSLMANEITALYAIQGYLLVEAFVPEQEIKGDEVVIKVVEGKVDKILVQGNKRIKSEELVERMARVREESILKENTLERNLLELNQLMGVQVKSILRPGELPGTSDLVLQVTETRPYRFSVDTDNFGSRFTGTQRWGASLTWGNIFKLGDQFSGRYATSDINQHIYSGSYLYPVGNYGTAVKLGLSFSEHELGGPIKNLAAGGVTYSMNLEVSHPFYQDRSSRHTIRGGFDYKHASNESQGIESSKDNVAYVYFGVGGYFSDSYLGRNFYDVKMKQGMSEGDTSRGLAARAGGQGDVFTTTFSLTRYQSAKFLNSYFILKGSGQIFNNLRALSSGTTSIGGMGTVRGYPISEFSGDNGYVLSAEYNVPWPWKSVIHKSWPTMDKTVTMFGFLDHGKVFVKNKLTTETNQAISGIGVGFKVNIPAKDNNSTSISFALTYGASAFNGPDPSDKSNGILYSSVLISY